MNAVSDSRATISYRRMMTVLAVVLVVAAPVLTVRPWLTGRALMPIRYVRVEGTFQHLKPTDVRQALLPFVVDAGWFSVALSPISTAAESLPWVDSAQVRRIWPDTLVVRIDEQRPIVRWRNDSLLNERGERFTPETIKAFPALPLLHGRDGQEKELFSMLKKVTPEFAERGLTVATLSVSERRAWTIRLTDGLLIKMGRQRPWKALDRFLRALPLLQEERIRAIESVDLRYPNGFAVRWKPGTEIEWRSEQRSDRYAPHRVARL